MASIAETLGRFSQFLSVEQQKNDIAEQQYRERLATQRVAESFSKVSPLNDEEDLRQLMIETVADASGLGALNTALPLIQGLYSDSVNAIKNYKARRQDELLKTYAKQEGFNTPSSELSGQTQFQLMQYQQGREFNHEIDTEDAAYLARFDRNFNEIGRVEIGPGWKEKARVTASYQHQYAPKGLQFTGALNKSGQPLVFNPSDGKLYTQGADGNLQLADTQGFQSNLTARLDATQRSNISKDITDKKTSQTKNYQDASTQASIVLSSIGGGKIPNRQGTGIDYYASLQSMDPQDVYAKLADKDQSVKDAYSQFIKSSTQAELDLMSINESSYTLDYNKMLDITKLAPEDYTARYNGITGVIPQQDITGQAVRMSIIRWRNAEKSGDKGFKKLKDNATPEEVRQAWEDMNIVYKGYVAKEVQFK
jgi:hypothetical protein